jgi:hypothetical protein
MKPVLECAKVAAASKPASKVSSWFLRPRSSGALGRQGAGAGFQDAGNTKPVRFGFGAMRRQCHLPPLRCLTLRSSGPPPAWHLAREAPQVIVPLRGPSAIPAPARSAQTLGRTVKLLRAIKQRFVIAAFACLASAHAAAEVKPLPRSEWPSTVSAAVPLILNSMTPTQRSVVAGTERDSLFLLLGEWGEDIEALLGLNAGNAELVEAACRSTCKPEQAALELMFASWEALRK